MVRNHICPLPSSRSASVSSALVSTQLLHSPGSNNPAQSLSEKAAHFNGLIMNIETYGIEVPVQAGHDAIRTPHK